MTPATSSAPTPAAGAKRRSTHRETEAALLACAAAGWTFELRPLHDVPTAGGGALLCVVYELASQSDLLLGK